MSGVTSDFISDCNDSCISIAGSHMFGGKIKSREDDGFVRCGGVLSVSVGKALLLEAESEMIGIYSWSAEMSSSFRLTCISALMTRCFAVECKARLVLTYLRNPILATRWVSNLLKVTQVRRDWGAYMML